MRAVIVNEDMGVFLGVYEDKLLFSSNDILGTDRACGFESEDDANTFMDTYMPEGLECFVIMVDSDDKHVSCIDIIKAGYGDYVGEMVDFLPFASETIH